MRFLFKTNYRQDIRLFKHNGQRFWYSILLLAVLLAPLTMDEFYLGELALVYIYAIAGIGLMLLVGYTGMVSLGHAAFLAIGAYAHTWFLSHGWPLPLALLKASLITALIGAIVGLPAMRMTGIYLAIATLAFAVIVEQVIVHWESVTGGFRGMMVPRPELLGFDLGGSTAFYFLCLAILLGCLLLALNILRGPTGRAMTAVRDSEISAQSMGIHLARTKSISFAHGVFYGAIFIGLLPQGIALMRDSLPPFISQMPGLEPGIFGLILILFLIYEPLGIYGRWLKIRQYFELFPLYRRATHKRQKSYLRTERMR
jgi:branched-chain amino acid transport system permease protein